MHYIERNTQVDPAALDELKALGFRSVPVTVIGERAISGFNPNQLSDALGLGIKVAPRDPSVTLPLLERAVEAVLRAVRQIPDDKLHWVAPDRGQPMEEFTYHIFRMVQRTMRGIETGVYPLDGQGQAPGAQTRPTFESFHEIARYGEEVIKEYGAWAARQNEKALLRPVPPGSGLRSGAEQLDLMSGHTVQHLRQLYFVLEQWGITPKRKMKDTEFPPEYVLTILW